MSALLTASETGLPSRCSIRARSRSAPVISARPSTRKMMWRRGFQRHFRLVQDLTRNILLVIDDDSAGVDQLEPAGRRARQTRGCGRA